MAKDNFSEHRQSGVHSGNLIRDQNDGTDVTSKQKQRRMREFAREKKADYSNQNQSAISDEQSTTTQNDKPRLRHGSDIPRNTLEEKSSIQSLRFEKAKPSDSEQKQGGQSTQQKKASKANTRKKSAQQVRNTDKKPKSRLQFTKEELSAPVKAGEKAVLLAGASAVHEELKEAGKENAAVDALHKSALSAESTAHIVHHVSENRKIRRSRQESARAKKLQHDNTDTEKLQFTKTEKSPAQRDNSSQASQLFKHNRKKKQVVEGYYSAKSGRKAPQSFGEAVSQVKEKLFSVVVDKKRGIVGFFAVLLLIMFFMTQLSSCGTMLIGAADAFIKTTWLSNDEDITAAEVYYTQLEAQLQKKINQIETIYSGYEDYEYDLDDIGHNPADLISYLSMISENGIFTFDSTTKTKLNDIFEEQYTLTISQHTETRTHTKTVRVGESLGQVVTSAYCNCSICCGQWAGSPTASGVMPQADHTLAVDMYNPIVPIGTQIVMNGKLYKVEDTGYLNRYGVDFDVYMDSHFTALLWGHKTFEAYLYDANGNDSVSITITEEVSICTVKLRKKSIDSIAMNHLNVAELAQYYVYKESGGNRSFLSSPVEMEWQDYAQPYGYRCKNTSISMHDSLDLELYTNAPVYSVIDGTVTNIGQNTTLGKYIVIENDRGYWIRLSHLNAYAVHAGQTVTRGELLGQVGRTGNVSRGTLGIELKNNGISYNPYFYLQNGFH